MCQVYKDFGGFRGILSFVTLKFLVLQNIQAKTACLRFCCFSKCTQIQYMYLPSGPVSHNYENPVMQSMSVLCASASEYRAKIRLAQRVSYIKTSDSFADFTSTIISNFPVHQKLIRKQGMSGALRFQKLYVRRAYVSLSWAGLSKAKERWRMNMCVLCIKHFEASPTSFLLSHRMILCSEN